MRIAIPSIGEDKSAGLSNTLGRARFILIYDSDSKKYSVLPNPGSTSLIDSAGIRTVDAIIKSYVDTVLTKGIGVNAYSMLAKEHITVLLINEVSNVEEAVKNYLKNNR